MKHKLPKFVRRKRAKGKAYYYFDTGRKTEDGKPILTRLPDVSDMMFGRKLAAAIAMRNKAERPQPVFLSVAKLIDLFQKSPQFAKLAKGTQTSYNHYLARIEADIGMAPVDEVTRADAMRLMEERGHTPAAANQILRTLGALYKWAREAEKTTARPTANIDLYEIGEHEPWPEKLLQEALASDDHLVSLSTALLYYTAQRLGDTLRMRWTDIRARRVEVKQEKTETPLSIRIHDDLAEHLEKTPRRGFTILAREDGRPYSQTIVRRALQAFAAERGYRIVPHGLRKNAVNALLEIGCSTWEVQAVSGQSPAVIEHYAKKRDKTKLGDAAILRWNKAGKKA